MSTSITSITTKPLTITVNLPNAEGEYVPTTVTFQEYAVQGLQMSWGQDGDATPEAWVNENFQRAQNYINALTDGSIGTQALFDALLENAQQNVANAVANLANYWISNAIFSEGESTSAATGSLSYSQTNNRAKDFVPKDVRHQLEMAGLYNRQLLATSGTDCDQDKTLTLDCSDDPYAILWGENKAVTYQQMVDYVNQSGQFSKNTQQLPAFEPAQEGGANQNVINKLIKDLVSDLRTGGLTTPKTVGSEDNAIANIKFVKDHSGGLVTDLNTDHVDRVDIGEGPGNTQKDINTDKESRINTNVANIQENSRGITNNSDEIEGISKTLADASGRLTAVEKKTVKFDAQGQLPNPPVGGKDPANKDYVDNHGGGRKNTSQIDTVDATLEGGSTQQNCNQSFQQKTKQISNATGTQLIVGSTTHAFAEFISTGNSHNRVILGALGDNDKRLLLEMHEKNGTMYWEFFRTNHAGSSVTSLGTIREDGLISWYNSADFRNIVTPVGDNSAVPWRLVKNLGTKVIEHDTGFPTNTAITIGNLKALAEAGHQTIFARTNAEIVNFLIGLGLSQADYTTSAADHSVSGRINETGIYPVQQNIEYPLCPRVTNPNVNFWVNKSDINNHDDFPNDMPGTILFSPKNIYYFKNRWIAFSFGEETFPNDMPNCLIRLYEVKLQKSGSRWDVLEVNMVDKNVHQTYVVPDSGAAVKNDTLYFDSKFDHYSPGEINNIRYAYYLSFQCDGNKGWILDTLYWDIHAASRNSSTASASKLKSLFGERPRVKLTYQSEEDGSVNLDNLFLDFKSENFWGQPQLGENPSKWTNNVLSERCWSGTPLLSTQIRPLQILKVMSNISNMGMTDQDNAWQNLKYSEVVVNKSTGFADGWNPLLGSNRALVFKVPADVWTRGKEVLVDFLFDSPGFVYQHQTYVRVVETNDAGSDTGNMVAEFASTINTTTNNIYRSNAYNWSFSGTLRRGFLYKLQFKTANFGAGKTAPDNTHKAELEVRVAREF